MKEIDLAFRTMFAELSERLLDAQFDAEFPVDGRFVPVTVKDRQFWYFDRQVDGKATRKYVGPASDAAITERVQSFKRVKAGAKARRKLVSTLVREGGLPAPDKFSGDLVAAFANAGVFRLRAVLVGTVAYQCYSAYLGVKLASSLMRTGDIDLAQFHAISATVNDSIPPVLEVLGAVDPSFREVPHQMDGRHATRFVNDAGFSVEFLTPNRGSDEYAGAPAPMSALGGAAAQPLRFLDFLIHEPVRSVMLHDSGIAVLIPAPERYAVHKLIVAARRRGDARMDSNGVGKREKDVLQASNLVGALVETRRQADLAAAFKEAWERGSTWRKELSRGISYMEPEAQELLKAAIRSGLESLGETTKPSWDPKAP